MSAHTFLIAAAAGVAATLGLATQSAAVGTAVPSAAAASAMRHGGPGRADAAPPSATLGRNAAIDAQGVDARPRLWMVQEPGESDTLAVEFVPAPDSGQLILVRHADRDPGETLLNATGEARARALPGALADLPLDAIFLTDFRRNADTAAPLAEARGLVPQVRTPDQALAAALARAAAGGSAIWIGNVGNLSHLWDAYRLPGTPPVEYGDIAVLTAEGGTWRVSRRTVAP